MNDEIERFQFLSDTLILEFQQFFERFWWHENNNYISDKRSTKALEIIEFTFPELSFYFYEWKKNVIEIEVRLRSLRNPIPIERLGYLRTEIMVTDLDLLELKNLWEKAEKDFKEDITTLPLKYHDIKELYHKFYTENGMLLFSSEKNRVNLFEDFNDLSTENGEQKHLTSDQEFPEIFTSLENERLFLFLAEKYISNFQRAKFSWIWHYMNSDSTCLRIYNHKKNYEKFVSEKYSMSFARVLETNSTYHDSEVIKLAGLKSQFKM